MVRNFLVLALGWAGALYLCGTCPQTRIVHAQTGVQPFYLERTLFQPDRSGNPTASKIEIVARRSDGVMVRMESLGPLNAAQHQRTVTFPQGGSVTVFDELKVKITWPTAGEPLNSSGDVPSDCSAPPGTLLRMDRMNGQQVAVIQSLAGRYRLTRWAAPRLACEAMYYTSEMLKSDGSVASLSIEAKSSRLVLAEPSPTLFDIGDTFSEVAPSEASKRLLLRLGERLSPLEKARIEAEARELDRKYFGK